MIPESEREAYYEKYLPLVHHIARRVQSRTQSWYHEDLIAYGIQGLWQGILTYRDDKNTKIITYLHMCIRNEMIVGRRAIEGVKRLSEKEGRVHAKLPIVNISSVDSSHESFVDYRNRNITETNDTLSSLRRFVNDREWEILVLYYQYSYNYREIGEQLGCSKERVRQIIARALYKVRNQTHDVPKTIKRQESYHSEAIRKEKIESRFYYTKANQGYRLEEIKKLYGQWKLAQRLAKKHNLGERSIITYLRKGYSSAEAVKKAQKSKRRKQTKDS